LRYLHKDLLIYVCLAHVCDGIRVFSLFLTERVSIEDSPLLGLMDTRMEEELLTIANSMMRCWEVFLKPGIVWFRYPARAWVAA